MKLGTLTKFFALFLIAAFALPVPASAQETTPENPCGPPTYRTEVRPNSSEQPTVVSMGMRLLDLTEINDVDQTISVDFAVKMQWVDSRLASFGGCNLPIDQVWFPEMTMKNSGRMFERWPQAVNVEEGGAVTYLQRISGTFSSYHNLAEFPFDSQSTQLRFSPLHWSDKELILRADAEFTGMEPILNISDWSVNSVEATEYIQRVEALEQDRAGYELTISAKRDVGFYIWKIIIPIALIVAMSWFVFWIDPMHFGAQIGLSATSFLTMVAFIFATTNMLPKLGYVTTLDLYITGATGFVFLAMLQSLCSGFLSAQGHKGFANKLDFFCRIVFPLIFLLFCLVIFLS
ncbi:MAG: hypothetical protein ABJI96_01250 [Paracoccaceae bacterium]